VLELNDTKQFIRLLAEIRACGLTPEQLKEIRTSTDLTNDQICEIMENAELEYERLKDSI
jgi:hypothetical protein